MSSPPSPSLFLLHHHVRTNLPRDSTAPKLVPLSSGGVKFSGFNKEDEALASKVSGFVLEAHLAAAPDLSFLVLRGGSPFTCINNVVDNLIVISSTLPGRPYCEVFLIFDMTDRSLSMIPAPRDLHTKITCSVVAVRHHGDERSYTLFLPGEAPLSLCKEGFAEWHDVLFIASTSPSSSTSPPLSTLPSSSTSPPSYTSPPSGTTMWQKMKKADFPKPELPDIFCADQVFSFRGHGYWADLLCGVMYCNCAHVLSDAVETVDFHFIKLPSSLSNVINPPNRELVAELRAFRTMGCVGGSIKFISIDGFFSRIDAKSMKNRNVRIWKLMGDLKWVIEDKLSMEDLWNMPGFYNNLQKMQSLFPRPKSLAPMYPFLTEEDRVIYFALGEFTQGQIWGSFPTTVHFLLRVDMRNSDVSFEHIPYSQTPTIQDYFGVDRSILCPSVAHSRDGKGKFRGLQAKMKGLKV